MKKLVFVTLLLPTILFSQHENHMKESAASDTVKKSIPKQVHAQIGKTHMMIHYHSPAVRGRVIWGGLVPYGDVWVTGAHNATTFEFNTDVRLGGKTIPAGKYAIFTIPGKDKWTFILNKNWNQHLADKYDAKEDITRVSVTPQILAKVQERLTYEVSKNGSSGGILSIAWEKVKIQIPFDVN